MELPKYPIGIVRGNWFRLHHPLEKVVWTENQKTIVDYIPQEGDKLAVTLQGAYKPYTMENVTIEGNVLKYENNGTLPCGLYDIVINVVLADGKRLRSHQDGIVKVVKTNKEASIPDYVEFGIDTYELDGAVFLYEKGDRGYSAYDIAVQEGFTGTVDEWLESLKGADGTMVFEDLTDDQRAMLKGDKGDTGVGIQSIEQTTTSDESEGVNVVTITLNDESHTEYTFEVKNGAQGLKGDDGKSAYQVYLDTVPEGEEPMSEQDWLASFKGEKGDKGDDGDSAYQVYLSTVPEGETPLTEVQWIASLKGEKGDQGAKGDTVVLGNEQEYTLYNKMGNSSTGAMTQAAVTELFSNYVNATDVASMLDP